ncbi:MAG: hypothetical protein AAB864_00955 [Patescibacteria group bacterium]
MRKAILIAIVVAAVCFVVFGSRKYKDESAGLTFSYPLNWSIRKSENDTATTNIFDEKGEMVASIRVSQKIPEIYGEKYVRSDEEVYIGPNRVVKLPHVRFFSPSEQYECYGIDTIQGGCSNQFSIFLQGRGTIEFSGILEGERVPKSLQKILSSIQYD